VLGSSGPGAKNREAAKQPVQKASAFSSVLVKLPHPSPNEVWWPQDACNAQEAPFPQLWGQRVGGVSEKANARGENLLSVAAVEGTLAHRSAAIFAGCRRKLSLGRFVTHVCSGARSPASGPTDDSGCPGGGNEEGNVVGVRHAHALLARPLVTVTRRRTRPSLAPRTRACAHAKAKAKQRSIRYRDRANPAENQRGGTDRGVERTATRAARRASLFGLVLCSRRRKETRTARRT